MAKKKRRQNPLADLLDAASPEVLANLIVRLASLRSDVRRECFEYLKKHASLSPEQKRRSEGEAVLALWSELVPDLDELDEYGGGDYGQTDHVGVLLMQIQEKLATGRIEREIRRELLEEVLPFIETGNGGLDDELYAVAHAACYEAADWRHLAQSFEAMQKEWPVSRARAIYRKLGDREKYLELRSRKMEGGADYHDLATYYWDQGDREQALAIAEQGMRLGKGRMDDLRQFLSERARETGDRERYLALQFDQATDHLTLGTYKAFKKICTPSEWGAIESRILAGLCNTSEGDQVKIRMHRGEYEQGVDVLTRRGYPSHAWDGAEELQTAAKMESRFPEKILKFYLTGLGALKVNDTRKEYARKAKVMVKVRHMYVDILKAEDRWRDFAGKVKKDNLHRPAFQEEFKKVVPDWCEIV
jgi:tetratricopeptide (TPR) repeat protein